MDKSGDNNLTSKHRELDKLKRPELEWGILKGQLTTVEKRAISTWLVCGGVEEKINSHLNSDEHARIWSILIHNEFVAYVIDHLSERGECPNLIASKREKQIMLSSMMRSKEASVFNKMDALKEDNKMAGHLDDKSGVNGGGIPIQINICTGVPDSNNDYWKKNNNQE